MDNNFSEQSRQRLIGAIQSCFRKFNLSRYVKTFIKQKPQDSTMFLLSLGEYKNVLTILSNFGEPPIEHINLYLRNWLDTDKSLEPRVLFTYILLDDLLHRSSLLRSIIFKNIHFFILKREEASAKLEVVKITNKLLNKWNQSWGSDYILLYLADKFVSKKFDFRSVQRTSLKRKRETLSVDKPFQRAFFHFKRDFKLQISPIIARLAGLLEVLDATDEDSDIEWSDDGIQIILPESRLKPSGLNKSIFLEIAREDLRYLIYKVKPEIEKLEKAKSLLKPHQLETVETVRQQIFEIESYLNNDDFSSLLQVKQVPVAKIDKETKIIAPFDPFKKRNRR